MLRSHLSQHHSRRPAVCGRMSTGTRCRCVFVSVAVCVFVRWSCNHKRRDQDSLSLQCKASVRAISVPHMSARAQTHTQQSSTTNTGAVPAALGGAGLGPQSVAERGGACEQQVWQCVVVTWKGMRAHSNYRLTRKHTRGVCTQFGMASTHSAATRIGEGVGIPPRSYVLSARMCRAADQILTGSWRPEKILLQCRPVNQTVVCTET